MTPRKRSGVAIRIVVEISFSAFLHGDAYFGKPFFTGVKHIMETRSGSRDLESVGLLNEHNFSSFNSIGNRFCPKLN